MMGMVIVLLFSLNELTKEFMTKIIPNRLNMAITWISWGAAPGYINTAPLGLKGSCLN
jgi:hypothetical protein